MKFGHVFAVSNLILYTKNCDRMLDPFYRDTLKYYYYYHSIVDKFTQRFSHYITPLIFM